MLDTSSGLPARLENYLRDSIGLTTEQYRQLLAGEPITKLLDVDETKEAAIFGGVWIHASAYGLLTTESVGSGGVLAGGTRWCVACSKAYASAISRASENGGPVNVTADGNGLTAVAWTL